MLLVILFAAVSLGVAAAIVFAAKAAVWKAVLAGIAVFILMNVLYGLYMILIGAFVKTDRPLEKQHRIYPRNCYLFSSLACTYGGARVHVIGKDKLPKDERLLFVSNHRSLFDPLSVLVGLREYNISFVSKPSNMKLPALGNVAYGAGFLPIDRENDRQALKTILTAANYIKNGLCSIFIYPEGTRSKLPDMQMLPFHAGSFKIAQRAGCPLAVLASVGTDKVFKNIFRRRTDITIEVLEVIPAEMVKAMSTAELSEHAREHIENRLKKEA